MPDPTFVHLRLHSEYSVSDGLVRIPQAIEFALRDAMPALALTDLANLFGMVKFYTAARSKGVKPIVGCDVWIGERNKRALSRALLLCQDRTGYLNLCELLSRAHRANQHNGRAVIDKTWLEGSAVDGLIALSGAHRGDIGEALLQDDFAAARRIAETWQSAFGDRFYIEIQRTRDPQTEQHLQRAVALAAETGLPIVATHPVQFMAEDDFKAHEARVCISEGFVLGDPRRPRAFTPDQYMKSQQEMAATFADLPDALANSVNIAKRCNLQIELGKSRLPRFPTPDGISLDDYLVQQAESGLRGRLDMLFPDPAERERRRPAYEERLRFEAATIIQMGFPGYFLIVADFINWAKHNGVPVGPGRGSGAGSLVAYSLGITDLDPIQYDLLFERFLNPERVSMPDFDIDFCQEGRDRVIEYVRHKYGADSVSQIVTFGTMAARAVVRDIGRVLDLSYNFVDQLAKLVPHELGMTLEKARMQEPQLNERAANEEEVAELLELAERLEGITRNVGMHAGGVLIAPGKLTDFTPLYCAQGSDSVVSQFDKDDVESVGLVKFDFLGLRTLTILELAIRFIAERELPDSLRRDLPPTVPSLLTLPLDDAPTYRLLSACNTTAIFQFESRGMRDLLKQAQPSRFEDIIALVALYRPGPMNLIPDWLKRKRGEERAQYPDPRLEPILGPTYGVMVYQEQVMQIAQVLGGYSLGSADLLRRAMGKKKPEEMAKHRGIFVQGAVERNVTEKQAAHLFDLMEKFAEYGFNKSHSAAYALVAYQTAYLKAHYPSAFMAATLSADMADTDKIRLLHDDCAANALSVLPPDINSSDYWFLPLDASTIRYGLGAIKGTGEAAIQAIVRERNTNGAYTDLFNFCLRIDKRLVNRRVVESLVLAGAFDSVDKHRARLLTNVGRALDAAEQKHRSSNHSLFGEEHDSTLEFIDAAPWSEPERLQHEKKALGFFFSGHLFNAYRSRVGGLARHTLSKLTPSPQSQWLAGIVGTIRTQMTRRGKMAFVPLDDGTAQIEVAVFNKLFESRRAVLKEDQLLVVLGKVARDDYSGGLRVVAEQVMDLSEANRQLAKAVQLHCNGQADAIKLKQLLDPFRDSKCPVIVRYHNESGACEITLGDGWRVDPDERLLDGLASWLGAENVKILY